MPVDFAPAQPVVSQMTISDLQMHDAMCIRYTDLFSEKRGQINPVQQLSKLRN